MKTFSQILSESETVVHENGKFRIGGLSSPVAGYYNPNYKWNGFVAPGFERPVFLDILKKLEMKVARMGATWVRFDDGGDVLVMVAASKTDTVDGPKDLYFFDSWTWSLVR